MSRVLIAAVMLVPLAALCQEGVGPHAAPSACLGSLPEVYEKVTPAVVSIGAVAANPHDVAEPVSRIMGSGFVVDASGLVVTNSHLVFGKQAVFVTLADGATFPAALVGADPILDIAVLRIRPDAALAVAELGDSDRVRVGEEVLVVGNPLGLQRSLTRGIVSAVDRALPAPGFSLTQPLIQTDAPMNPGNSGGPLVGSCGQVLGIATAILADAQGIGFAIPVNLVKEVVPRLLADGRLVRPWLGLQGQFVSAPLKELLRIPLVDGFLVEVVEPGSPAEQAGLRGGQLDLTIAGRPVLIGGDVITAIGGRRIEEPEDLQRALQGLAIGEALALTLARGGERLDVACVLTERPILPGDAAVQRAFAPAGGSRSTGAPAGGVQSLPVSF